MRIVYAIIGATLLSTTSAFAVDFAAPLLSTDGKSTPECIRLNDDRTKCIEEVNLTLGWLSRFALDQAEEVDPRTGRSGPIALSDVIKRGSLSEKIKANPQLDLSVDEAKLIKDQILKLNYKVGIKFQAIRLIDPKGIEENK